MNNLYCREPIGFVTVNILLNIQSWIPGSATHVAFVELPLQIMGFYSSENENQKQKTAAHLRSLGINSKDFENYTARRHEPENAVSVIPEIPLIQLLVYPASSALLQTKFHHPNRYTKQFSSPLLFYTRANRGRYTERRPPRLSAAKPASPLLPPGQADRVASGHLRPCRTPSAHPQPLLHAPTISAQAAGSKCFHPSLTSGHHRPSFRYL